MPLELPGSKTNEENNVKFRDCTNEQFSIFAVKAISNV